MTAELLLVSDLDDTFLGDHDALQRFAAFYKGIRHQLTIAYASGRGFDSIQQDIQQTPLPQPVAVIGAVGSEIRSWPDGTADTNWIERISHHWSRERVEEILADEDELTLQPRETQSPFKVSYYFENAEEEQLNRLRSKLFDEGINASLIYSSARDLDFLPEGVNKGTAAAFLAKELGYSKQQVIVAGNSGNDAKLFEHENYGIVVSNAHEALKRYAKLPRVYLARRSHADGIQEGLEYWLQQLLDPTTAS